MKTIHVTVLGGVVQSVSPIPKGIEVVVLDHDIECFDPEEIMTSPLDERPCTINRYWRVP